MMAGYAYADEMARVAFSLPERILCHVRSGRCDAAVRSKVCKHFYATHEMTPPSFARLLSLRIPRAILCHKARGQMRGKRIAQFLLWRKLDEVVPEGSLPIP
jgi:hypothetical protein